MTKKLHVADGLSLPVEAVTQTFALLARRGAGKTYAAKVLAEEMLSAGFPIVVLDPTGAWFGLRAGADGDPAGGYPVVIMGGAHADVPLEPTGGKVVADFLVNERVPTVLDLSAMGEAEMQQFVGDLAERFYRTNTEAVHWFVDEADEFCLPDDTDLLTIDGWVCGQDVREGMEAVAFNLDSEDYRYEPVKRVIRRWHDGPMVHLRTRALDCMMTADHRAVIQRTQRARGRYKVYDWTFCPSGELPCHIGVPSGGAPIGQGIPNLSNRLLRIIGWVLTDGNWHNRSEGRALCITQANSTVKCGVNMVGAMDCELSHYSGIGRYQRAARERVVEGKVKRNGPAVNYYLGQQLSSQVLEWLGEEIHRIPRRFLIECSAEQLRALFQGLLEGDGSAFPQWRTFTPGNQMTLADDFQELALRLGYSASVSYLENIRQWRVNLSSRPYHQVRRPLSAHYTGWTWDITVPSGAFVARRNGKVFVTGNCPQDARGGGPLWKCLGAMQRIVRRGRIKGIGCTLITQRSAVLNKSVLTQSEVLVAMQTTAPQDLGAVAEWLKYHSDKADRDEILNQLPGLQQGQALVYSPGWLRELKLVTIRPLRTFDSSRTPKPGEKVRAPKGMADVDLAALQTRMAATVEKARADDPKELRRRIADLERQLRDRPAQTQTVEVQKVVEVPVLKNGQLDRTEKIAARVEAMGERFMGEVAELRRLIAPAAAPRPAPVAPNRPVPAPGRPALAPSRPVSAPARPAAEGEPRLSKTQQRILDAIAWYESLGTTQPTLTQIGAVALIDPTGGHFSNTVGPLSSGGLVVRGQGTMSLTDAGRAVANVPESVGTLAEYHDVLRQRVRKMKSAGGKTIEMLNAVIGAGGRELTTEEIGRAVGIDPTGGHFSNTIGPLGTAGLIQRRAGVVMPTEVLFPLALTERQP